MALQEFPYDQRRIEEDGELFPEEVFGDSWVAFHGTSGAREQTIEKAGLQWPGNQVRRADIENVVRIFRAMNWSGLSTGGLPVLEPFTLGHDFGNEATKPVYLAECSLRGLTFATLDFAGGETFRALRYALRDLETYVSSEEARTAHSRGRGRRWDATSTEQTEVSLDWLRAELGQLSAVHEQCKRALADHQHGVVYAIRFGAEDLAYLTLSGSMGIEARGRIAPSKLIAKVLVPKHARAPVGTPNGVRDRWLSRLSDRSSLLGRLRMSK
jgi:hypothetical protein